MVTDELPTPEHSPALILIPGTLLRINQFIPSILPIAKSTFWAGVKSGRYPKPVKLSERITCWRSEDIIAVRDNTYTPVYSHEHE